jgi:hypothetical protein
VVAVGGNQNQDIKHAENALKSARRGRLTTKRLGFALAGGRNRNLEGNSVNYAFMKDAPAANLRRVGNIVRIAVKGRKNWLVPTPALWRDITEV